MTPTDPLRPEPHRAKPAKKGVARETKKELTQSERRLQPTLKKMERREEEALSMQRAERAGLPYINLMGFPVDTDALGLIPEEKSKEAKVVAFWQQGRDVRLGAIDPTSSAVKAIETELVDKYGYHIRRFLISPHSLDIAMNLYWTTSSKDNEETGQGHMQLAEEEMDIFEQEIKNIKALGSRITELPTTEVLSTIVAGAVKTKSSDIHIEPTEDYARLRYRIDGVLQDITDFSLDGYKKILSRVKVLARLKLNVHKIPQDGSFILHCVDTTIDIRVSILPGGNGENIVMRLLDRNMSVVDVKELGMKQRDLDLILETLKKPDGMILNTGPTGSGKTTTLATLVKLKNKPEIKAITLEDPIEYRISGVEQTQVDESAGYTFASGLRSILRQDPDIILIGEIRDTDTAETAMHAALTGHLVFSTLHTNDAPGAIPRLIDMGVQPFIIAPAMNTIIAQRLVRRVCEKCAKEFSPDQAMRDKLRDIMKGVRVEVFDPNALDAPDLRLVEAVGCAHCNETGYRGRVGVFEIFSMDGEVEKLTMEGADSNQIREAALRQGMTTITQDGVLKMLDKTTTFEEVQRVGEE